MPSLFFKPCDRKHISLFSPFHTTLFTQLYNSLQFIAHTLTWPKVQRHSQREEKMDVVFSWLLRKGKNLGGCEAAFISISRERWWETSLSGCATAYVEERWGRGHKESCASVECPMIIEASYAYFKSTYFLWIRYPSQQLYSLWKYLHIEAWAAENNIK